MHEAPMPSPSSTLIVLSQDTNSGKPETTIKKGLAFFTGLTTSSIVEGMINIPIKQVLLPAQIALITAPKDKIITFSIIASIGALAGGIASPLMGTLSDRFFSRLGRRRIWLIVSILLAAFGLLCMALAQKSLVLVVIGEILIQVGASSLLSLMTAVIPDQLIGQQRTTASSLIGLAPVAGGLVGLLLIGGLVGDAIHQPQRGYWLLLATSLLFVAIFLVVLREKYTGSPQVRRNFFHSLWINPLKRPDFFCIWLSKAMMFLGYTVLIAYLLYYLEDHIHSNMQPDKAIIILQLVSTFALIIAAIVGGRIAARLQRLKIFIFWSSLLMTLAMLLIAFIPLWPVLLIAELLLGIGFGIYASVDFQLALAVSESADTYGRDLGWFNTAYFFPLILSPLVGNFVLTMTQNNYTVLFCVAAASIALGAVAIHFVKGVR